MCTFRIDGALCIAGIGGCTGEGLETAWPQMQMNEGAKRELCGVAAMM